jgi:hypothetical protein
MATAAELDAQWEAQYQVVKAKYAEYLAALKVTANSSAYQNATSDAERAAVSANAPSNAARLAFNAENQKLTALKYELDAAIRAEKQTAANAQQENPETNAGDGGTEYKAPTNDQNQAASGSLAGDTGNNNEVNDGQWQAVPKNKLYNSYSNLSRNEFLSNPRDSRLANAGLYSGGANSPRSPDQVPEVQQGASDTGGVPTDTDWRVRISLPPGNNTLYNTDDGYRGFMEPLVASGIMGVVFPYTPTITLAYNARYQEQALTHSNFKSYFYEGSDVQPITISGEFTAQNQAEAQYVLACVYFLRAATKMLWGNVENAGAPPPILKLNGFGQEYFPDVSCVLTNFTHTMPADVDYIGIYKEGYNGVRVPVASTIAVTLQPVYSRKKVGNFDVGFYGRSGGYPGSRFL